MSRSKAQGGLTPEALFDTSEGSALEGRSAGTEVLGGLVSEEAVLIVESGRHAGERVVLGAGTCVIGRSSKCALILRRSAGVSRRHSKVIYVGGTYELSDCGSRNGTRVNGRKVGVGFPLNDGDLIQISDERIRFRGPSGRQDPDDTRGLLVDVEPPERRLPSREQPPGEIQRTQRVRVDSPDSLLMTQDGGTAPDRPVPPRKNPVIPPHRSAQPAAPTALFTAEVDALRTRQPPPIVMPPDTLPPTAAERDPPKGALFALGVLLGVTVLIGGVAAWDLALNDGRVAAALRADVEAVMGEGESERPGAQVPSLAGGETAVINDEKPDEEPDAEEKEEAKGEEREKERASATSSDSDSSLSSSSDATSTPTSTASAETPSSSSSSSSSPGPAPTDVAAPTSARVLKIPIQPGAPVQAGKTTLAVLDRSSPRVSRKLRALRREEKAFERHAALGNARAKRDLDDVRREIARLERRSGTVEVKAPVSGRVDSVLVEVGARVKAGTVVVRVVPDGS